FAFAIVASSSSPGFAVGATLAAAALVAAGVVGVGLAAVGAPPHAIATSPRMPSNVEIRCLPTDASLPPSRCRIVIPFDLSASLVRHGGRVKEVRAMRAAGP